VLYNKKWDAEGEDSSEEEAQPPPVVFEQVPEALVEPEQV